MEEARLTTWIVGGIVIITSLSVHEFSHAAAAYLQGDDTAEREGRLTLNPLAHLDPLGTLLPIVLILSGSPFVLGWAKPVPFNPFALKNPRWGSLLVGLAGPLSNFVMFLVCALLYAFVPIMHQGLLGLLLITATVVNFVLGCFNLLPFAPLDGSKIIAALIPPRYLASYYRFETYSPFIFLAVFILAYPMISAVIGRLLCFVLGVIGGSMAVQLGCRPWQY